MVLLDGGSSWSAPGSAALLEPPAVASAAAVRCPGNLLELRMIEEGSGEPPPGVGTIVTPRVP